MSAEEGKKDKKDKRFRNPRQIPGLTYDGVLASLRGNFEGLNQKDADDVFTLLSTIYPQGSSLSALEATEAILRAGFTRNP